MELLIAIGSINAFFFALVIYGRRGRRKANHLLAMLFLVLGLSFGMVYLSCIIKLPALQLFVWNIGLLIAPMLWLYAYLLVKGNVEFEVKQVMNFIPWVVSWIYLVFILVFNSETEVKTLFNNSLTNTNVLFVFFTLIEILSIPFYIIMIFRLLKKHRINIRLFFSTLTHPEIRWLQVLLISVLFIWLLINSLYFLSPLSGEISIVYGFGGASVFILCMGYLVLNRKIYTGMDKKKMMR